MDSAMRTKERNVRITAAALGFTRPNAGLPRAPRLPALVAHGGYPRVRARREGDTLIPLMLTGNAPHVPESLFGSLRTLTAHMGPVTATDVGGSCAISISLLVAGGPLPPWPVACGGGASRCASWHPNPADQLAAAARSPEPVRACRPPPVVHRFGRHRRLRHRVPARIPAVHRGLPTLGPSLLFGDTPPLRALLGTLPVWDGIWPACAGTFCLIVTTMLLARSRARRRLRHLCRRVRLAFHETPVRCDYGHPRWHTVHRHGHFQGFALILFLHRLGIAGASPAFCSRAAASPCWSSPRSWSRPGRLWKGCPPPCA